MTWVFIAVFWLLLGVVVGIVVGTFLRVRDETKEARESLAALERLWESAPARRAPYDWRHES